MIQQFKFIKPSLFIILLTTLTIFFLTSLGIWQLQRAAEKRELLKAQELSRDRSPIELQFPLHDLRTLQFQRIRVTGTYVPAHQFLLDNQIRHGQAGFNVLTPFKLAVYDQYLLIDRGWIPLGSSRVELPEVAVDDERKTIIGSVYLPTTNPYQSTEIDANERTWPRVIQFIDFSMLATRLQLPLQPLVVRLDPAQPDGYLREWPQSKFSPQRHLGYAIQWFLLALTVFVIFVVLHIHKSSTAAYE